MTRPALGCIASVAVGLAVWVVLAWLLLAVIGEARRLL